MVETSGDEPGEAADEGGERDEEPVALEASGNHRAVEFISKSDESCHGVCE